MKPEGIYVRAFRQNKEFLQDIFQKMEDAMQREIKRLQQTELLLNTGGGHISNAQDEAEHWFQDYKNTRGKVVVWESLQRLSDNLVQDVPVKRESYRNYERKSSGKLQQDCFRKY